MRDECSCGDREEVEGGGGSTEGSEQGGSSRNRWAESRQGTLEWE